jgi:aspartyl-tRNA(Asn)/glutamyl-tRNA(Gln) amidotransferase subunit A
VSQLTDLTVAALRDGVRDGAFSAREVAQAFLGER